MKRAGPKPHLVLTGMGVCLLKPYCLQPCCHYERVYQKQLHHKSPDTLQSHPGNISWSFCFSPIACWIYYCLQHHPTLDTPVGPDCCSLLCLFSIKRAQCLCVPETKQSYRSQSSLLTAHISVFPAANTCLLTLISRNFMSPGDGCEYTNKMLQVL